MKALWLLAAAITIGACANRSEEDMGAAPEQSDSAAVARQGDSTTYTPSATAADPAQSVPTDSAQGQPEAPAPTTEASGTPSESVPTDSAQGQPEAPAPTTESPGTPSEAVPTDSAQGQPEAPAPGTDASGMSADSAGVDSTGQPRQ